MLTASPTGTAPARLDPLPHRLALDVLEGDVVKRPVLPDAEHPRDVLVVEPRRRPPLLVKPRDDLGVAGLIGRQELERDLAVELGVEGAKDRPHPAHADRFLEQKRVDEVAGAGRTAGQTGRQANRRLTLAAPSCSTRARTVGGSAATAPRRQLRPTAPRSSRTGGAMRILA